MVTEKKEVVLEKLVIPPWRKLLGVILLVLGFLNFLYPVYIGYGFLLGLLNGFLIAEGLLLLFYCSIDISCPYCGFRGKVRISVNPPPLSLKCPRCQEFILLRWES